MINILKCFGTSWFLISQVKILKGLMEGKHLVITCSLTIQHQVIQTHILIDCAVPGIAFMDKAYACHNHELLRELEQKKQVQVINSRTIE